MYNALQKEFHNFKSSSYWADPSVLNQPSGYPESKPLFNVMPKIILDYNGIIQRNIFYVVKADYTDYNLNTLDILLNNIYSTHWWKLYALT